MNDSQQTLVTLLEEKAFVHGDKPLFTFVSAKTDATQVVTYQEMFKSATLIAKKLTTLTQHQDRIILLLPPGIELMTAFFGCVFAGNIAILHYPPTSQKLTNKLYKIAHNAGSKIIISEQSIIEKMQFDQESASWLNEFSFQWLEYTSFFSEPAELQTKIREVKADDVAFLQYTSGSTGNPKGVMVTHKNIIHNLTIMQSYCNLNQDTNIVSWLPPYHDMGLILCHLEVVYCGASGYYITPLNFLQNPKKWLYMLTKYSPAFSVAPNFAFDYCVDRISEAEKEGLDLSNLVAIGNAAEPVKVSTLERFYEAFKKYGFKKSAFRPAYGLAEATLYVSAEQSDLDFIYSSYSQEELKNNRVVPVGKNHPQAYSIVSCGKPHPILKIIHPDTHEELPEQRIGEIWINSPSVAKGYWKNEETTNTIFHAQIRSDLSQSYYLRTGDLGFFDNGKLYITGRLKDLIIIRGCNYYPQDIEYSVEKAHPMINRSGAAAFPINLFGDAESLGIVCEINTKEPHIYEEVCQSIRKTIFNDHNLDVCQITLIPARKMPKTTSGKVQRKQCKESIDIDEIPILYKFTQKNSEENQSHKTNSTASPSITAYALLDWFQKWLDKENCFVPGKLYECNFEECGIDSLKAAQISADLGVYLKMPLDPTLLWEQGTFGELAEFLAEKANENVR